MNVISLYKSPLKGAFQIQVQNLWVSNGTIVEDRILVAKRVDDPQSEADPKPRPEENEFLSMRYAPRMTFIHQSIRPDCITLHLPKYRSSFHAYLKINLEETIKAGNRSTVNIWDKDAPQGRSGFECSPKCCTWLSGVLGKKVVMLLRDDSNLRTKNAGGNEMRITFHDSSAIHAVSLSSLQSLGLQEERNEPMDISARRFRPNVVIDTGLQAFAEDEWDGKAIVIGGKEYQVRKKTVRCHVPYINPLTGKITPGLQAKLKSMRTFNNEVLFGFYLYPLFDIGCISMGDKVLVS